jgi:hypothetical protein
MEYENREINPLHFRIGLTVFNPLLLYEDGHLAEEKV